jgi:hypothetical protein
LPDQRLPGRTIDQHHLVEAIDQRIGRRHRRDLAPRIGTSLSIAVSDFVRPNNSPALAACGFVYFIWPRKAPTIGTSE